MTTSKWFRCFQEKGHPVLEKSSSVLKYKCNVEEGDVCWQKLWTVAFSLPVTFSFRGARWKQLFYWSSAEQKAGFISERPWSLHLYTVQQFTQGFTVSEGEYRGEQWCLRMKEYAHKKSNPELWRKLCQIYLKFYRHTQYFCLDFKDKYLKIPKSG